MYVYKPEGFLIDTIQNSNALRSISSLQEAYQTGKILEARAVMCDCNHNLIIDLGVIRGVIPREETALGISDGTVRDIAIISRVNKPVCFKITGFDKDMEGKPVAILSRRIVQQECIRHYISTLRPGDIISVRVSHLEPFGCFVDIACGIASLIPIDSISVSRISHPRDRFKTGQTIYAVVKTVEENNKITLSHKELLGSWQENASLFHIGETVAGIVRSVEDYGIFVELTPNLAGLAELRDDVYVGQHTSVYIKNLIPEKMKVKLIIVDAFDAIYDMPEPNYFFEGNHMSRFVYSPPQANKVIQTIFDE